METIDRRLKDIGEFEVWKHIFDKGTSDEETVYMLIDEWEEMINNESC